MPRRLLFPLLLAVLLTSGCDLLFPPPSALQTALNRCDLSSEPTAAYRQASLDLIAAAESGTLPLASDRWFVGYADDGLAVAAPGAPVAAAVRSAYGLARARTLAPGLELVTMRAASRDAAATARRVLDDPRVRFVHPDVALRTAYVPNDPFFDLQWTLGSFGLPAAWEVERGSSRVTVAILDTAFDLDHPDLATRFDDGYDFFHGDPDPGSFDTGPLAGHGTHVAGIVGAVGNDAVGVTGVAPEGVRLLPVQVFDDAGREGSQAALVAALHWVAGRDVPGPDPLSGPVDVANLSLGTAGAFTVVPAIEDAVRTARRAGVLVLAASGNSGSTSGIIAPANGPCAIAIGSVDEDLGVSTFSNYDAEERRVDLVAPGGENRTWSGVLSTFPDDDYGRLQGTSMSTPWVAGVAALLASQNPGWTSEDLLEAMLAGAWLPPGASPLQMGFGIPCPDALLGAPTTCGP